MTDQKWEEGQCWHMRFGSDQTQACLNPGLYRCPDPKDMVARESRWCALHKQLGDVRMSAECDRCPKCQGIHGTAPCPGQYKGGTC